MQWTVIPVTNACMCLHVPICTHDKPQHSDEQNYECQYQRRSAHLHACAVLAAHKRMLMLTIAYYVLADATGYCNIHAWDNKHAAWCATHPGSDHLGLLTALQMALREVGCHG